MLQQTAHEANNLTTIAAAMGQAQRLAKETISACEGFQQTEYHKFTRYQTMAQCRLQVHVMTTQQLMPR